MDDETVTIDIATMAIVKNFALPANRDTTVLDERTKFLPVKRKELNTETETILTALTADFFNVTTVTDPIAITACSARVAVSTTSVIEPIAKFLPTDFTTETTDTDEKDRWTAIDRTRVKTLPEAIAKVFVTARTALTVVNEPMASTTTLALMIPVVMTDTDNITIV